MARCLVAALSPLRPAPRSSHRAAPCVRRCFHRRYCVGRRARVGGFDAHTSDRSERKGPRAVHRRNARVLVDVVERFAIVCHDGLSLRLRRRMPSLGTVSTLSRGGLDRPRGRPAQPREGVNPVSRDARGGLARGPRAYSGTRWWSEHIASGPWADRQSETTADSSDVTGHGTTRKHRSSPGHAAFNRARLSIAAAGSGAAVEAM